MGKNEWQKITDKSGEETQEKGERRKLRAIGPLKLSATG